MEVGAVQNHATQAVPKGQSEEDVKDILNAGQHLKSADQDQELKLQGRGAKEDNKGNAIDQLA